MSRHGHIEPTMSLGEGSSSRLSDSLTSGTTQPWRSGESQDAVYSFGRETVEQIEAVVESVQEERHHHQEVTSYRQNQSDPRRRIRGKWATQVRIPWSINDQTRWNRGPRFSLLKRIDMDCSSATPHSANERTTLIEEVKDMENLTRIMLRPHILGLKRRWSRRLHWGITQGKRAPVDTQRTRMTRIRI